MHHPVHIFLADDDADDRALFYEAIRTTFLKAELSSATNGEELLKVLLETKTPLPRIVFLDLNMPIKNGHESLVAIRSHNELKTIPVIIYSTSTDPVDIQKTFEEGADFYIAKPSSFSDLKHIIKTVVMFNRKTHIPPHKENFVLKAVEA